MIIQEPTKVIRQYDLGVFMDDQGNRVPAPIPALKFATNLPPTKSANVGDDVTWSVVVAGGETPYAYSWLYNDVEIDASVNPSAATESLINHSVQIESNGSYACKVTDNRGESITSVESVLTVTAPVVKSISAEAAKPTANGGDTVAFNSMFNAVNCSAADFDYVVTPTAAGTVNATSGLLTLAGTASGSVTVKATAKTATGAVTGSPATFTITAVTAQP